MWFIQRSRVQQCYAINRSYLTEVSVVITGYGPAPSAPLSSADLTGARAFRNCLNRGQELGRAHAVVNDCFWVSRCRQEACTTRLSNSVCPVAVPGIVDMSDLVADSSGVARIVLEAVQDMLMRVALQTARDDYEPGGSGSVRESSLPRGQGGTLGRSPIWRITAGSSVCAMPG